MQEVVLHSRVINDDQIGYSLDGMIDATIHNDGTTEVQIQHQIIKPGDSFSAGLPNHVSKGAINIEFTDTVAGGVAPVNKLILHFHSIVGPYINPQTGAKFTPETRNQIRQHNRICD